MASQDCPNCHYPAPNRKKPGEGERVPQGMYHAPDRSGEPEECPQCFYQPEAVEERPEEECPQCFYQPEDGQKRRRPRRTTALSASISRINKNW
ncbi:MAG: hypothetical protein ACLRIS_10295 [Flavonifractor plautii]